MMAADSSNPATGSPLPTEMARLLEKLAAANPDGKAMAAQTIRAVLSLGYRIEPPVELATADSIDQTDRGPLDDLLRQLQAAENAGHELNVLCEVWSTHDESQPQWHCSPEPYRHLSRRFLALGAAPLAREVARSALEHTAALPNGKTHEPWGADVELRQLHGLALARTANAQRAQAVLAALRDEGQADEETLGMLARTYKDLALAAGDERTSQANLAQAHELYEEAHRHTGGYWTGINVATLAALRGLDARAAEVAGRVREQCLAELARQPASSAVLDGSPDAYWLLATLGEAALAGGNVAEAEHFYKRAYERSGRRLGDINSTRRHARWLLGHQACDASLLDDWLPLPQVVVFAGHMIDLPSHPQERFPARLASDVKAALRAWLEEQRGLVGFSSAACGSDILFLEAVHELGGETYVVLPFDADQFMVDSVSMIPGADWPERFQRVLEAATQVITASPQKMTASDISYDYANLVLHGLASVRARQLETKLVGLAVWDGEPSGGIGGTANVVSKWRALRLPVYHFDLAALRTAGRASPPVLLPPSPVDSGGQVETDGSTRVMAMLFGDAVNFSKLVEDQVPRFIEHFLGPIAELLRGKYAAGNVVRNTWGDGLYLVFDTVRDAGSCALDICDFVNERVRSKSWSRLGLPNELNVRLALHAGPVFRGHDPVTGQLNYTGTHVSRAARLEPKTPPGEVYASEAFAALATVENVAEFTCEYVKQLQWAKHYGTFPTYVLRRSAHFLATS